MRGSRHNNKFMVFFDADAAANYILVTLNNNICLI